MSASQRMGRAMEQITGSRTVLRNVREYARGLSPQLEERVLHRMQALQAELVAMAALRVDLEDAELARNVKRRKGAA